MEIYRESDNSIKLRITDGSGYTDVDSTTSVAIRITDPNDSSFTPVTGTAIHVSTGLYEFDVPFSITLNDRILVAEWTYTLNGIQRTIKNYIDVVTPYVSLAELLDMFNGTTIYSVDKLKEMEQKVRYIINNFTRQEFGNHVGSYKIYGSGEKALQLPYKLISNTGVSFGGIEYDPTSYYIKESGWFLARKSYTPLTIKESPPDSMLDGWTGIGGIIMSPYASYWDVFRMDTQYTISGTWGYESVPGDVNLAAKILIEDYACDQSSWRDKYVESIRASDWNFKFNSDTFYGTGNVQVDQLLSPYVQNNMEII